MGRYFSLEHLIKVACEAVRPPDRMTVAEAAEEYRYLDNPGSYTGDWLNSMNMPMVQPMEVLSSMDHTAMVFVGPAQCAKSETVLNWLTHSVMCDPMDMMIIEKSQTAARDFHQRRLDKLYRTTPELKKRLFTGKQGNSTYSSRFRNGMLATMSWPTVNELSGKPVGRLWLMDYDRMDADIGGEGAPFDLARNRAKTFGRFGMTVAESSPSRTVTNARWMPKSPHEAPPTTGILALYNRGDRRRWYWPCMACGNVFEPDFSLMWFPDCEDNVEAAEQAELRCPHCNTGYREGGIQARGLPSKLEMNQKGFWLGDGQRFDPETGEIIGNLIKTDTASFWLKGPAAAFAKWEDMVLKYLNALTEFENTGDQNALKTTINTEQGLPYLPQGILNTRMPEDIKARAEDWGSEDRPTVPRGVRFLVATVDVQPTRFEIAIHGIGEGPDVWLIDRFKIRNNPNRLNAEGHPDVVQPHSYVEDWDELVERVALKTYPLDDDSGREMQIKFTGVDSGGKDGTTRTGAEFWRALRKDGSGMHTRIHLLKGEPSPKAPLVKIDYPDAERKDRRSGLRGDVPLIFIQSNKGKDMADNMLARGEPGGGYVHYPSWAPDWVYAELTAETRGDRGWENPGKHQNETWDLLYYCLGICYSSKIGLQRLDWSKTDCWWADWDTNDLVSKPEEDKGFIKKAKQSMAERIRKLGEDLAG